MREKASTGGKCDQEDRGKIADGQEHKEEGAGKRMQRALKALKEIKKIPNKH